MAQSFVEHVSEDDWVDFVENRVSAATMEYINAHLQTGCEECNHELAEWRRFLNALNRSSITPPASVLQKAFNLFESLPPRPSIFERIMAHLVFDSRLTPVPVGVRGPGDASFHLLFEASDTNIALWCEHDGEGWNVTGQALPANRFWNVVARGDSEEIQAELDDEGEFRFTNIVPGRYLLTLRGQAEEVMVHSVDFHKI